MSMWFVVREGTEHGPFTNDQLRQMVDAGRIETSTPIRRSDQAATIPAGQIENLFVSKPLAVDSSSGTILDAEVMHTPGHKAILDFWSENKPLCVALGSILGAMSLFMVICCGCTAMIATSGDGDGKSNLKRTDNRNSSAAERPVGRHPEVKHDRYTHVVMPLLPASRIHEIAVDKPAGEKPTAYEATRPIVVPDIAKVDFSCGANGEPIEMDRFIDEKKNLRSKGYYYRNQKGQKVAHGPWVWFKTDGEAEVETLHVHGVEKSVFTCYGDKPDCVEEYFGDDRHTRTENKYFDDNTIKQASRFKIVHQGNARTKVPHGLSQTYYDNTTLKAVGAGHLFGGVWRVELYEDGKMVGGMIYNRQGDVTASGGKLKVELNNH